MEKTNVQIGLFVVDPKSSLSSKTYQQPFSIYLTITTHYAKNFVAKPALLGIFNNNY